MDTVVERCPTCDCLHEGTLALEGEHHVLSGASADCECVCHGRRDRRTWSRLSLPEPRGTERESAGERPAALSLLLQPGT